MHTQASEYPLEKIGAGPRVLEDFSVLGTVKHGLTYGQLNQPTVKNKWKSNFSPTQYKLCLYGIILTGHYDQMYDRLQEILLSAYYLIIETLLST